MEPILTPITLASVRPGSPTSSNNGRQDSARQDQDRLIHFNVGGVVHITRKTTIESRGPNFLTQLVQNDDLGVIKTPRDRDGNLFIDRNGHLFGMILDYFRTGELYIEDNVQGRQLLLEFDYFGVKIEKRHNRSQKVNPSNLSSIVDMWRTKAAEFVETNGTTLVAKLASQLLEGDNQTVLQFSTTKDGMTRIGSENILAYKTDHLFLKFISEIMYEQYNVRAVWKSTQTVQKYNLQLILTFEVSIAPVLTLIDPLKEQEQVEQQ